MPTKFLTRWKPGDGDKNTIVIHTIIAIAHKTEKEKRKIILIKSLYTEQYSQIKLDLHPRFHINRCHFFIVTKIKTKEKKKKGTIYSMKNSIPRISLILHN